VKPRFRPTGIAKARAWEWGARFAFGGLVAVATGLVANRYGPVVGGLLLAFPAILPASLTLVKQHDGRAKAADDARGARIGSIALAAFGAIVWLAADSAPPAVVLAAALAAWLAVAVLGWSLAYGIGKSR
jgi:hypothetical protein